MNPQNIVYLGLIMVGLGVSICAIDPLKPLSDIDTEINPNWFALGITFENCLVQLKEYNKSFEVQMLNGENWETLTFDNCQTSIINDKVTMIKENEFGVLTMTYEMVDIPFKSTFQFTSKNHNETKFGFIEDFPQQKQDSVK